MKKVFLHSILFGIGLYLSPSAAMANASVLIPSPESGTMVSGEDVNVEKLQGISLPTGVSNVRFQRFYENGFMEGPDDLCIVTYKFDNKTHIVQFQWFELCEKGIIDCGGKKKNTKKVFRLI